VLKREFDGIHYEFWFAENYQVGFFSRKIDKTTSLIIAGKRCIDLRKTLQNVNCVKLDRIAAKEKFYSDGAVHYRDDPFNRKATAQ
jgi:hypothetical protein